ncbi:MAG: hypothetical protein L0Z55_07625 [Planctomycetes bacterium]|nr:hypothetical protein [Planctomycetota bacterium]
MNIQSLLPEVPDEGLLGTLGVGVGHPSVVFLDHKGRVLTSGNLTRGEQDEFPADLERAKWAFDIYRAAEKDPANALKNANVLLLDLFLERRFPPIAELEAAATTAGADERLVKHFQKYRAKKPVIDVMNEYEKVPTAGRRKECAKLMYAVFADGVVIDDPADALFTAYWTMAFDGAVAERNKDGAAAVLAAFAERTKEARPVHKVLRERMEKDLAALEKEH